jgi:dATP pyrophosphohydrolase
MSMKPYKIPESVLVVIHTADLQVLLIERADRRASGNR